MPLRVLARGVFHVKRWRGAGLGSTRNPRTGRSGRFSLLVMGWPAFPVAGGLAAHRPGRCRRPRGGLPRSAARRGSCPGGAVCPAARRLDEALARATPRSLWWRRFSGGRPFSDGVVLLMAPPPVGPPVRWDRLSGGTACPVGPPLGWDRLSGGTACPVGPPVRWDRLSGGTAPPWDRPSGGTNAPGTVTSPIRTAAPVVSPGRRCPLRRRWPLRGCQSALGVLALGRNPPRRLMTMSSAGGRPLARVAVAPPQLPGIASCSADHSSRGCVTF
ncbi:hypothetical protein GA0070603_4002 [Micromonospora chersina]|uniref:Uncharacterized protein n=1 Tax=Micromonospora chersina TaxID=47854 RepID=A0A1C6VGW3_9ACTN|nr:hypothetical protein GA0070603_4002 [Micromonospora chersina]